MAPLERAFARMPLPVHSCRFEGLCPLLPLYSKVSLKVLSAFAFYLDKTANGKGAACEVFRLSERDLSA